MSKPVVMLSIPGLRTQDLNAMPTVARLAEAGTVGKIEHQFPCMTWPSQCNVLTGNTADQHGVVANGFFWRHSGEVEMWTAWNEVIERPQIWDVLKQRDASLKTAAWFPMLSKGCQADFVCMPAPIHQPDGSEDMWCYTKPQEFYGELLESLGHFPLKHFWGPLAGIPSSQWIAESACQAAEKFQPDFWYIYLPHLDYAAQKDGPDSPQASTALAELDGVLQSLVERFENTYDAPVTWLVVSEYVITEVNHVTYPNRVLREAGLLQLTMDADGKEQIDYQASQAWALVDHQLGHVFIKDRDADVKQQVVKLFEEQPGFQMVLSDEQREQVHLSHERSGDVVLVSADDSWQAYYWWLDDSLAPLYAHTVDIHRKPGYDPVELFFDFATKSVPLDATLVKGSHGVPAKRPEQQGLFVSNQPQLLTQETIKDTAIYELTLQLFNQ